MRLWQDNKATSKSLLGLLAPGTAFLLLSCCLRFFTLVPVYQSAAALSRAKAAWIDALLIYAITSASTTIATSSAPAMMNVVFRSLRT